MASVKTADTPGVLQVVLSLASGGTERLVVETVKRLMPQFRMAVCCLDQQGELAAELTAIGVPVAVLDRRPGFHPGLGRRIAALASSHGASILHCHQYTPFVYGCCAIPWNWRTRVIFTEHGRLSDGAPSAKRRLANRMLRTIPSRVYTVSHDLRRHLLTEGFREDQVRVLHNGVKAAPAVTPASRAAARRALDIPSDAFVVGAVGRLDPVKSLDTLIQAIATVQRRSPNTRLVLVGEGPERPRIEAEIHRLGLAAIVTLVGYRSDVGALMPAFDIYANSSTTEGISLTILEAMSAALPVVATAVGGTPEVVIDGESGLLVPARNGDAMAEAILGVIARPDGGASLGQAGRQRVLAEFSFDRMVDEYRIAYLSAGAAGKPETKLAPALSPDAR